MASPPPRYSLSMELSERSVETADDTSAADYPLTRQPGRTSPDAPLLQSTDSQKSIEPVKVAPRARGRYETRASFKKTTKMSIPLKEVNMIQLFLRAADGSVKGISFDYEDSDVIDFGCCVAEPGCWYMCKGPQWLLFKPARGRTVSGSHGFVPIEKIGFVNVHDCPETEMDIMGMRGSLTFRLSKKGLELDVGLRMRSCRRIFQRAEKVVESRLGAKSVLARLSISVQKVGNRISGLTWTRVGKEDSAQIVQAGKKPSYFNKVGFFGIII